MGEPVQNRGGPQARMGGWAFPRKPLGHKERRGPSARGGQCREGGTAHFPDFCLLCPPAPALTFWLSGGGRPQRQCGASPEGCVRSGLSWLLCYLTMLTLKAHQKERILILDFSITTQAVGHASAIPSLVILILNFSLKKNVLRLLFYVHPYCASGGR